MLIALLIVTSLIFQNGAAPRKWLESCRSDLQSRSPQVPTVAASTKIQARPKKPDTESPSIKTLNLKDSYSITLDRVVKKMPAVNGDDAPVVKNRLELKIYDQIPFSASFISEGAELSIRGIYDASGGELDGEIDLAIEHSQFGVDTEYSTKEAVKLDDRLCRVKFSSQTLELNNRERQTFETSIFIRIKKNTHWGLMTRLSYLMPQSTTKSHVHRCLRLNQFHVAV